MGRDSFDGPFAEGVDDDEASADGDVSGGDDGGSDGGDDGTAPDGPGGDDGADDGSSGGEDPQTCTPVDEPIPAGFHVAVDGSPEGDGSDSDPWDLPTALAHPDGVEPGDIIYLHEGVYPGGVVSELSGQPESPIVVRSYPGQWATIDGASSSETTFRINGQSVIFRDFELTNSFPDRSSERPSGYYVLGANIQMVNLVIHDLGNNGFWQSAVDSQIYGSIIYNNGYDNGSTPYGHAIYTQNLDGQKRIADNIIFNGYNFGIHAYTEGGSIDNYLIEGNIWFGSGSAAAGPSNRKDNCLIGGLQPASGIELRENLGWADPPDARSVRLGWGDPDNDDVQLHDNYFVGRTIFAQPWSSVTMTGNTFYGGVDGEDPADHPDNEYLESAPAEPVVFVRPNEVEPGRAHIAVYNYPDWGQVEVDLSGVVDVGARFEIRDAQDFFGPVVAEGVYDGERVVIPMEGRAPVQPVGSPDAIHPDESTGSRFGAFVLQSQRCE